MIFVSDLAMQSDFPHFFMFYIPCWHI